MAVLLIKAINGRVVVLYILRQCLDVCVWHFLNMGLKKIDIHTNSLTKFIFFYSKELTRVVVQLNFCKSTASQKINTLLVARILKGSSVKDLLPAIFEGLIKVSNGLVPVQYPYIFPRISSHLNPH